MMEKEWYEDIVEKTDNETKLAVTAWVFTNIVRHAMEGGSYRYLIYDRLGFGPEAYVPLYDAGGMEISNEFDMSQKSAILDIVQNKKIEELKEPLNLCDESGCFVEVSAGFPTEDGGYRRTCYNHSKFAKEKE
jgi:hypothetical protein